MIVVGILGLLFTLMVPAAQRARESARNIACKSNLKQLAIAGFGHHDVHGHYPTGGWGWYWVGDADRGFGADQPGGWMFNLLPYVEEYSLFDRAGDGDQDHLSRIQRVGAAQIVQTPLSIINCPTRRPNVVYPMTANEGGGSGFFNSITPAVAGRGDYAANSGHVYNEWPVRELGRGPSNYADAHVWTINRYWGGEQPTVFRQVPDQIAMTGISFERSKIAMKQVTDGMSHTYFIGEKHVPQLAYATGFDYGDNETWCTGFNNDNYRKTARVEGKEIIEAAPVRDDTVGVAEHWGRFGSAHLASWNAAFCDGSVRGISYDIDWRVHRDLGNRLDGAAPQTLP